MRIAAVVCLSSDTEVSHAQTAQRPPHASRKRKAAAGADVAQASSGPNTRPRKERQPNWGGPEILALINAKEKEHEASKLTADSRDLMETATQKWTKIATDVSKVGFSTQFRGAMACKDKWQTLFAEYKKISDYRSATGNTEDYFHMSAKRRKELTLPPNFSSSHFQEMEKFLSQRPCLNPPRQRDSFTAHEGDFHSTEDLARYCAQQHITEDMLAGEHGSADAVPHPNPHGATGSANGVARSSRGLPPTSGFASKGKDKLDNAAQNMSTDPRPSNTAVKRRQTSSQSKMVEVTETQGREIVTNMKRLSEMEEKKVLATRDIADKQLEYFKIRDSQIAITQRGLVQAVQGLSEAIANA